MGACHRSTHLKSGLVDAEKVSTPVSIPDARAKGRYMRGPVSLRDVLLKLLGEKLMRLSRI